MTPITIRDLNDKPVVVPCGRCYACLQNHRSDWTFRLKKELQHSEDSAFVTLTYADDYEFDGNVHKKEVQDFLKRYRKAINPVKLRYYCVSEYGPNGTRRPHYHLLLFFNDCTKEMDFSKLMTEAGAAWPYGFISVGAVEDASIHYCTGYILTRSEVPEGRSPNFSIMSRKPGIGASYLTKEVSAWHRDGSPQDFVYMGTHKKSMPRYYRQKLYSDAYLKIVAHNNKAKVANGSLETHTYEDWEMQELSRLSKKFNKNNRNKL